MIDVALAIDPEAVDVTRTTPGAGSYDAEGFWVEGTPAVTTIKASVQPTNPRELRDLPEGIRSEATYTMRTRVTVSEDDEITYNGKTWRILKVATWPSYTKAWLGLKK